jgi:serine/threonine protein kinase
MTYLNLPSKNRFIGKSIDDYLLDNEIGRGKIGVVYLAHHKDIPNLRKACKLIPSSNIKPNWHIELEKVGKLIGIPQVVQHHAHGSKLIENEQYVYIFSEYVHGVNLRDYSKNNYRSVTLPFIENLMRQLLQVFIAMKETGISHDDLHAGNILVQSADPRFPDQEPRFKISDFGMGGSHNRLKPKDDYIQFAIVGYELLEKCINNAELDGECRRFYDHLVQEFLPKYILEKNPTIGTFVQNPRELLAILAELRNKAAQEAKSAPTRGLKNPFDYLSCEHMGNDFHLLHQLYSQNFPGYDELLLRSNTILTGPRGCGKTTIFKNLSFKSKLSTTVDPTNMGDFVGIYYYCGDLYSAFPYLSDKLEPRIRAAIVHYFNLALASELLDTLIWAQRSSLDIGPSAIDKLHEYITFWLPHYQIPPQGTAFLLNLRTFMLSEKQQFIREFGTGGKLLSSKRILPLDFIPNLCKLLQQSSTWMKNRAVYFFIDDYSLPRISKGIQTTLNDLLLARYEDCLFKISTESITTFHPYDSKEKLLDETREYDVVDLGDYFLHASETVRRDFLLEVINNRLKNSLSVEPMYHDISSIVGNSHYPSYNELALEIRNSKAGVHAYYYGWDIITGLCSGDIAHMLRLIRDIVIGAGGYEKLSKPKAIVIPIDKKVQDHAIKELGNDFLARISAAPETGNELQKIAEAFGKVANHYLRNRNSKNQANNPPWQAFRIEVRENPALTDHHLIKIYNDLLKYAVFLRDSRGKSQRGAVVPRLYLRRLLLPTFLLTPNKRDNIGLEATEFEMLLRDPPRFVAQMIKKRAQDDLQRKLRI